LNNVALQYAGIQLFTEGGPPYKCDEGNPSHCLCQGGERPHGQGIGPWNFGDITSGWCYGMKACGQFRVGLLNREIWLRSFFGGKFFLFDRVNSFDSVHEWRICSKKTLLYGPNYPNTVATGCMLRNWQAYIPYICFPDQP